MKKIDLLKVCLISVPFIMLFMIIWTGYKEHKKETSFTVTVQSITDTINTDTVIVIPCNKRYKYIKVIITGTGTSNK